MSTSCAVCKKVDVKLRKCGGCGDAAYCSVEHQREHWNSGHKNECKQNVRVIIYRGFHIYF